VKETGEGCDDGNAIAGDGCGPTCQLEPSVTRTADPTYPGQYIPVVNVTCGDGLKVGSEGCDDGNTTSGDGCSASCAVESGWTCSDVSVSYPSFVDFKITYRDFKQRTQAGGHPHMKRQGINPPNSGLDLGIVGPVCTTGTFGSCGRLDVDGKPVYDSSVTNATIDSDSFDGTQHGQWFSLWYRDSNPNGYLAMSATDNVLGTAPVEICPNPAPGDTCAGTSTTDTLRLSRVGTTSAYQFSSASNDFYPLGHSTLPRTERGFGYTLTTDNTAEASYSGSNRNFHFTSELRYFFKYKGGETLTFYGDDDVWVFVNGRLAVDIGGIHSQEWGRVILGDESGDCTQNGGGTEPTDTTCYTTTEQADATDGRFGIEKGNAYEIVVFQAERHPTGSNYRLTLDGFLSPRSTCETDCGDGIRAGTEVCDEGGSMPASGYDVCLSGVCTFQFCGDGDVYSGEEDCDSPGSFATYQSSAPGACGFDCQRTGYCGDGIVQSAFEVCDDGINDGRYLGCEPGCQALGPYCGDGNSDDDVGVDINGDLLVNSNDDEQCDTPGAFDTYAAASPGACGFNCRRTGYCGDNIRNGPELCDGSLGCNDNCEFDPFCGDGLKTSDEQCDYGVDFDFEGAPEDAPYGGCTDSCLLGPRCGDELVQASVGEECDDGTSNVDGEYNACDTSCLRGPRCGDGIEQSIFGEDCDNGFNEDDYAYPGAVDSCAPGCEDVPFCGDAAVQSAYELCDDGDANSDGAYDGCTTSCEWGPYCGDGLPNGSEECDDGVDNVAYSPTGDGCSYQCSDDVPYCGDGVRNGPEQCDLGTDANNGEYGGCEADCTRAPYCGDDIIQAEEGEACDDGPSGSSACTQSCTARSVVK
jgi:cysteine-rich repeat protein